jgi:predicted DNA-binding protein (UPF0251 family)
VPVASLDETILTFTEVEVIRLIDYEELGQEKVAKQMKISQPTLSRILKSARKKMADAVVNGKAIRVQGGRFQMAQPRGRGLGRGFGRGAGGRGRMGGFAAGPGGVCICVKCGHEQAQVRGQPCMNKKCPKCGSPMTRG